MRSARIEGPYRFWLERAWGRGPQICWVMLNPSTADAERDDPTLRRIMGFSLRWGFGSLIVVNLYPFRSPAPVNLRLWRARLANSGALHDDFVRNAKMAAEASTACDTVVAAWGAGIDRNDELLFTLLFCGQRSRPTRWECLGVTSDGSPIHPLARGKSRVPDNAHAQLWSGR